MTTENTTFTDMGADDIGVGVTLYKVLGLNEFDLSMPDKMRQIQEISEFMSQHPDPIGTIERVARANKNPNFSQLEHLAGFVQLSKQKLEALGTLDELNNQLKYYE